MTPQSKLIVGRAAGSTSLDGTASPFQVVCERLEAAHVLGHRDLGGQTFHARGAEEPDDAGRPLEHVTGVLRLGERAAVAEHDHVGVDGGGGVAHRLDLLDALVERLGRLCADRALRRQPHVRHEHVRAGAGHRLGLFRVEHVRRGEQAERRRLADHLDLEVVPHAGLLEVRSERPVDEADRGEVLDARETGVEHVAQEVRHQTERIRAAHAREHRRVAHHRQHLAGHLHDDRVRVAVGHEPGQRPAPRHPVAAGVVDDDQIRAAGLGALGRQAGPRARTDDHAARIERRAQLGPCLLAGHRASLR